jgi:hypothetical protein
MPTSKGKPKSRKVVRVDDTRDEHYGKIPRPKDFAEEHPAFHAEHAEHAERKKAKPR